jgi:mono/diheme cytochrome c family protein
MMEDQMRALPFILSLAFGMPAMAQDARHGEALFGYYCATCHGSNAAGNGPMSPSLVVTPTDLTTLRTLNGGIFPTTRVVMRVDGRDPLVSHGSMMPVYGDFFAGTDVMTKTEAGQPLLTSQPIIDLLAYIEGLQQE